MYFKRLIRNILTLLDACKYIEYGWNTNMLLKKSDFLLRKNVIIVMVCQRRADRSTY